MPVYAPEIERWWLSSGADAFDQLFDVPSFGKKARECGFAQAAHHRLRVVDNDSALQAKFRSSLPEIRSSEPFNYAANPRRNLALASLHVFKHPDDGGLDYSLAMQGLGLLDAAEVHRLRIFSHTKTTLEKYPIAENYLPILEELHRTASLHYGQCHMGFRACVSPLASSYLPLSTRC
jgi:hypothetical protein